MSYREAVPIRCKFTIDKIVAAPDRETDVQFTITGTAAGLMQTAGLLDQFKPTKKPPLARQGGLFFGFGCGGRI